MKRFELVEFHDLRWFPKLWRDMLTDYLAYISCEWGAFHTVLPKLKAALEEDGSPSIIDLCSGASGPLIKLGRHLYRKDGTRRPILLTDKYPNLAAFEKVADASHGNLGFVGTPVDAMNVPAQLEGFRTLFAAFHHFNPEQAQQILRDAVAKQAGIAIFEYTERNRFWILRALRSPLLFWKTAPAALKPMTPAKVFWIYILPLPVLLFAWDSLVSCLRTYTEEELKAMAEALPLAHCAWEVGHVPSFWGGRVTYLIGLPKRLAGPLSAASASAADPLAPSGPPGAPR
jgi:hypothetical protein